MTEEKAKGERSLFAKAAVSGLTVRNRLVRSATWEGMCEEDGRPTEQLAELYGGLARGGVGLVITGYTYVSPEGKQMPGKMGIHTGAYAASMRDLADSVHRDGGKICVQLVHAGGQTMEKVAGRRPIAPSSIAVDQFPEVPEAMTAGDIDRVVAAFGDGAGRAREYGFDAVQLHAAHGYLISQFLSPLTNRRDDGYGGTVERRTRFLLEVFRAVRAAVGAEFPVMAKLNGSDFLDGGLDRDGAMYAAHALDGEGIDAIEVSGGTSASGKKTPVRTKIKTLEEEGYHLPLAAGISARVSCPVMAVGGFRSLSLARDAVESGRCDFVSLSRPLIREPDLPAKWEGGESDKAECISCNGCFRPGLKGEGIRCVKKEEGE